MTKSNVPMWGKCLGLLMCLIIWSGTGLAQKDGGFGMGKDTVDVTTILPPKVLILQNTFSVEVGGPDADTSTRSQILSVLRSVVPDAKKDIQYVDQNGELRLAVTIDAMQYSVENVSKKVSVSRKGSDGKYYSSEETHTFAVVDSSFRSSFRIEDWASNSPIQLDTGSSPRYFHNDYDRTAGHSPPSKEALKQQGIDQLIVKLKERIVATEHQFAVLLGKVDDKLKPGSAFAKSGSWELAYDTWQKVPPFEGPKAESYRYFNLGVALEAQGYEVFRKDEDADTAIQKFTEAKKMYLKALQLKPEEKYFRKSWSSAWVSTALPSPPPLERVEDALKNYQEWRKQKEARLAAQVIGTQNHFNGNSAESGAKSAPSLEPDSNTITNDHIIQFVKLNTSEEFIKNTILTSAKTRFDLSVQGRLSLLNNGVKESLVLFMEQHTRQEGNQPIPLAPDTTGVAINPGKNQK